MTEHIFPEHLRNLDIRIREGDCEVARKRIVTNSQADITTTSFNYWPNNTYRFNIPEFFTPAYEVIDLSCNNHNKVHDPSPNYPLFLQEQTAIVFSGGYAI